MSRPPWFYASFSDGSGNQPPAFTPAYWIGIELGCLPTQLMVPDSVNVASHGSPRLSPSPNDCHPKNRMA